MTDLETVGERTWILTGSPENYAVTRELGFTLIGMKERVRKWPADSWTLAFQGQLRTISDHDSLGLMEAMGERARTPA